jgi:hypothetical protein
MAPKGPHEWKRVQDCRRGWRVQPSNTMDPITRVLTVPCRGKPFCAACNRELGVFLIRNFLRGLGSDNRPKCLVVVFSWTAIRPITGLVLLSKNSKDRSGIPPTGAA